MKQSADAVQLKLYSCTDQIKLLGCYLPGSYYREEEFESPEFPNLCKYECLWVFLLLSQIESGIVILRKQ
jgi:hypothetical protein